MRTRIRNVRLFDGERTIARADVVIEDDLIAAVGTAGTRPAGTWRASRAGTPTWRSTGRAVRCCPG